MLSGVACHAIQQVSLHEQPDRYGEVMQFIEGLDIGIWNFLQAIRQNRPVVDAAIAVLHWLDTPLVLLVLLALAVLVCINRHQVRSAVFLLAAFLGGGLLAWGTLELVGR